MHPAHFFMDCTDKCSRQEHRHGDFLFSGNPQQFFYRHGSFIDLQLFISFSTLFDLNRPDLFLFLSWKIRIIISAETVIFLIFYRQILV